MGMISYLSKFSARLSELSEPIRELSKEKVPSNLGLEHQEAFNVIKKEIAKAPILAYYNPNKEMVLQTDTSIKVLGACLMQQDKPVYFTSKALTKTQKRICSDQNRIFGGKHGPWKSVIISYMAPTSS